METVVVRGEGPRAQRLLDEIEARSKALTKQEESRLGSTYERRYLVVADSPEATQKVVRDALGSAADEFAIE
jgi:hypothetical protein